MTYRRVVFVISMALAFFVCQLSSTAFAETVGTADYYDLELQQVEHPTTLTMAADALIARPLLLGATAVGAGLFLVSVPFSVLGGNSVDAGRELFFKPMKATFIRCLGCTG